MKILKLRHIGLVVNDLNVSLNFYCNFLGFEKVLTRYENSEYFQNVNGIKAEALTVKVRVSDGRVIELIEYKKPKSTEKIGLDHTIIGKIHQCYLVDNIKQVYDNLFQLGVKFISKPLDSADDPAIVVTCYDPDDNMIEFVEIKDPSKMPKGLEP
jgi:catechol 2,3-dioxygenase-like lactoylglutathione lyase family enzyme